MEEGKKCKAIELRSGKELPNPHKNHELEQNRSQGMDKENEVGWVEVQKLVPQPEQ